MTSAAAERRPTATTDARSARRGVVVGAEDHQRLGSGDVFAAAELVDDALQVLHVADPDEHDRVGIAGDGVDGLNVDRDHPSVPNPIRASSTDLKMSSRVGPTPMR